MKKFDRTLSWYITMAEKNGFFNMRDFFLLIFLIVHRVYLMSVSFVSIWAILSRWSQKKKSENVVFIPHWFSRS